MYMCCVLCLVAQSCLTLCDPRTMAHQSPLWNSPGKNTELGSHSLLQGWNLGLLHSRQILYYMTHPGSLVKNLELLLTGKPVVVYIAQNLHIKSPEIFYQRKKMMATQLYYPCLHCRKEDILPIEIQIVWTNFFLKPVSHFNFIAPTKQ